MNITFYYYYFFTSQPLFVPILKSIINYTHVQIGIFYKLVINIHCVNAPCLWSAPAEVLSGAADGPVALRFFNPLSGLLPLQLEPVDRIGLAFGLGLERGGHDPLRHLDIRLLSEDERFLKQFRVQ